MIHSWDIPRMRNVGRVVAGIALVAALLPVAVATGRMAGTPYRVRMDGYVGSPPEGRREMADLLIRAGSKDVRFQVTAATVISGNALPATIFRRVRPYRPNFILRGPQEKIRQVEGAASSARLRIVGLWRTGSRTFLVSSVEALPASAPTAP